MKQFFRLLNSSLFTCRLLIVVFACSVICNVSYSQNFSGLEGKNLSKVNDVADDLVSLIGTKGIEGKIDKITVIKDSERSLRVKIEYSGYVTAYLRSMVLNDQKTDQTEVKSAEIDLTGKTSPLEIELVLKDNVTEGFTLESPFLMIKISKSKSNSGAILNRYGLNKSWQKEINAANLVLNASLEPVGITADLRQNNKQVVLPEQRPVLMQTYKLSNTGTAKIMNTSGNTTEVRTASTSSAATAATLDGTWMNVDPNVSDITRVIISNNSSTIQTFAKCSPNDCDWGIKDLNKYGEIYRATYDQSIAISNFIIEITGNQIKLNHTRTYKDNRPAYSLTHSFAKQNTAVMAVTNTTTPTIDASHIFLANSNLINAGLALNKSETDKGAQGPDNKPISLWEDLTVTKDFEFPYEITNIQMDIYPDKNPASGIFYYLPAAYHLRWTEDDGYAFDMIYGTSSTESAGNVRMVATLSPGISKKETDFIEKLLNSYIKRNPGTKFEKLRLIPIQESPTVSFPSDLNSQYEITSDKVSVNISSSLRDPFQVSWVTDNNTKDEMQVALLEDVGIQGLLTLKPQSESVPTQKIPVIITLADSRTIGRIDLENKKWRTDLWKNQTPYPLKLKYLHMLLVKDEGNKSTPFIYSWNLNDVVVPSKSSVKFDASKVPSWLDDNDMAQRIWLEYSVVDCDACDTKIISDITGGTYGSNTKKVSFETFQIFDSLDASFIQIKIRSIQADPKGEKVLEFDPVRISEDNKTYESEQLYVPLDSELSYEYFITVVMKNGRTYKTVNWISSHEQEMYLGMEILRQAIPSLP